ncbi:GNAT family N-acetyltransferase [Lysinibacillus fusiformis]
MKEAEIIAKQLGMNKIGLNVFGHNKIARGLYEKMGYEITNITMAKTI